MINIISNASHAMRAGGGVLTVSLDTSVVDQEFARTHAPLAAGLAVCLTVSDTGHGMTPTLSSTYTSRFSPPSHSARAPSGPAGRDGHRAKPRRRPRHPERFGRGTTVRIFLPAAAGDAPLPSPEVSSTTRWPGAAHPARRRRGGRGRHRRTTAQEPRVPCVGHTSAERALEAFGADPGDFDLLFTDLTMPGMTGTALAHHVRRGRPAIPVIIATVFRRPCPRVTTTALR